MAELNRVPDPPNSPIEKLITENPLESIRNYIEGRLGEGPVTNEEVIELFTFYDEKMQYEFSKQNRIIEQWANIHSHSSVVGGQTGYNPLRTWTTLSSSGGGDKPSLIYNPNRDTLIAKSGDTSGYLHEYFPITDTWNQIIQFTTTANSVPVASYEDKAWVHDYQFDWEQIDISSGIHEGVLTTTTFNRHTMEATAQTGLVSTIGKRVYVIGLNSTDFAFFDPDTSLFTYLSPAPASLWGIEFCPDLGIIIGLDKTTGIDVYTYKIATDTWTSGLINSPVDHSGCAMAVSGKKAHFFGGNASDTWSEYDIEEGIWVTGLDLTGGGTGPGTILPATCCASARSSEEIYLIKGSTLYKLTA